MTNVLRELFSLEGHAALVTGASSGLGEEIACAVASAGAHVLLAARREQRLEATRRRIEEAGGTAETLAVDLATDAGLDNLVRWAGKREKAADILVNVAGVNPRKPARELTREEWDLTFRLHLTVPFFLARELVGGMEESGWGRIINIASVQSVRAMPDSMPYGASKGGVLQLTRAMAEAWSPKGICCNAIAPGLFPTELTEAVYSDPERVAAMAAKTCVGRNGELSDIHGLAVFLASPAAAFVTGQTIFIDGGLTAK